MYLTFIGCGVGLIRGGGICCQLIRRLHRCTNWRDTLAGSINLNSGEKKIRIRFSVYECTLLEGENTRYLHLPLY